MRADLSLWQTLYSATGPWGLALLFTGYLLALIRGDPAGRSLVHTVAVSVALGMLIELDSAANPPGLSPYIEQFVIDALLLAMFTVLALRSPRLYPLGLAALQLLIAVTGALVAARLITNHTTHAAMIGTLALVQLVILIYGLIVHRRRRPSRARANFRHSHLAPRANRAR